MRKESDITVDRFISHLRADLEQRLSTTPLRQLLFSVILLNFALIAPNVLSRLSNFVKILARPRRPVERAVAKPPTTAQYLLELLAPVDWSEAAVGDLFERYARKFRRVAGKHGVLLANVDYWWQVLRSAPGLLRIRFRDLAALAGVVKLLDVLQKYWTAK